MKYPLLILFVLVVLLVGLMGCNGVALTPKYSSLLDQTAALSAKTAERAALPEPDGLSREQMAGALKAQAETWQMFRDARDGVSK